MKAGLTLCLLVVSLATAHAQVFRPHSIHGHSGRGHSGWGYYGHRGYGYRPGWSVRPSISFYYSDYGWGARPWSYGYRSYPVYSSADAVSVSRAGSGLFWGGLLGAIIGNNSGSLGHNAWRGAAYGAAAGYLLGAVGDSVARQSAEREPAGVATAPAYAAPAESSQPPSVAAPEASARADPNSRASAMSSANALFGR